MVATVREITVRADPFGDLSTATVREVLHSKGWTGVVDDAAGLALELGELVVLVATGKVGEASLQRLVGAHGELPPAPRYQDSPRGGDPRTVRVYRRPAGVAEMGLPNAVNLHGSVAGVSVLAVGREVIPPSSRGGVSLRWARDAHAATTRVTELPAWLVEMARDPAAAARAWGTARPTGEAARVLGEWEAKLVRARGRALNTFGNLCKIFRHCPEFAGRFALNEMTQAVEFEGRALPEGRIGGFRERIEDASWGGFGPSEMGIMQAIRTVAEERRYHPVREYLAGLMWDGNPRLDAVAEQVLHARPAPLLRETVRKWFISAVARATTPGCKVDTALVLIGGQGKLKSTFFYELAPRWFGDTEIRIGDKDAYGQIHMNWITEWGELDRVTDQRHAGEVKAFVSRRADDFRPPYGRSTQRFERSCIMVGSVNGPQFLNDPTGARRFWCVTVDGRIDIELLRQWRDQLWAEAVAAHRAGEHWWFEEADEGVRAEHVDRHRRRHPWEELVAGWIEDRWPAVSREKGLRWLTTGVILQHALGLLARDMTQGAHDTVGKVMGVLGYEAKQRRPKRDEGLYTKPDGQKLTRINVWLRPEDSDDEDAPPVAPPLPDTPASSDPYDFPS